MVIAQKHNTPNENGLMLGNKTVELNENGLVDCTPLGVSTYKHYCPVNLKLEGLKSV